MSLRVSPFLVVQRRSSENQELWEHFGRIT
jgi:hypothetical protein